MGSVHSRRRIHWMETKMAVNMEAAVGQCKVWELSEEEACEVTEE